jgi:membrane protein implicated in regulation of membrane protease activity
MEFVVEPWHWLVLGILLILSELVLPAFAALWFGIAAVMVCILLWLFPMMGFTTQVITWGILSILCTILWFKFIKPLSIDKTKAGLSREATIGQVGWSSKLDWITVKSWCVFQCLYSALMSGTVEAQLL